MGNQTFSSEVRGQRHRCRLQRLMILSRDGLPVAVLHVVEESSAGIRQRLRGEEFSSVKNAAVAMGPLCQCVAPTWESDMTDPLWEKGKQICKKKQKKKTQAVEC